MSFVSELKRRNVFRVAALYAVASWALLQVGDLLFGALGVPSWGIRLLRSGDVGAERGGTQIAAAYDAYLRGRYFFQQGEVEATLRTALAGFEQEPVGWQHMTGRALVFAKTGRTEQARAEMKKLHDLMGDAPSYQLAEISAQLGDVDGVFHWLENARRVRDPGLPATVLVDPLLDPIRNDPRLDALLQEVGLLART